MSKATTEAKELAVRERAGEIVNFDDPKIIKILQATVAKDSTPEEFAMFASFCRSTGLNPFKKEIWFIKVNGGRVQMMTGINGYLAIANAHPQFDGMEVDVTTTPQGVPVKATAKVYRKDRRFPSVGIALMAEFRKDTPIWKSMPSVMLTKCAKTIALREAFPQEMNGLYTEEEMPAAYATPAEDGKPAPATVIPADKLTPAEWHYYDVSKLDEQGQAEALRWFLLKAEEGRAERMSSTVFRSHLTGKSVAALEIPEPMDEPGMTDEQTGEVIDDLPGFEDAPPRPTQSPLDRVKARIATAKNGASTNI